MLGLTRVASRDHCRDPFFEGLVLGVTIGWELLINSGLSRSVCFSGGDRSYSVRADGGFPLISAAGPGERLPRA